GNFASVSGGAIYADGPASTSIIRSTISGNTALNLGGAIPPREKLSVVNSTLNRNSAGRAGGALFPQPCTKTLTHHTLPQNRADSDGSGDTFKIGGGLSGTSANVTLNNTIVAGNFRGTGSTADDINFQAGPSLVNCSNNLIGTGGSGGLGNSNGNQVNV